MQISHILIKYQKKLKQIPRRTWIIGLAVFLPLFVYSLVFFIPKNVQFSYAGQTCTRQLVLFPDINKQTGDTTVVAQLEGVVSIGAVNLYSTSVCFTPNVGFATGVHSINVSPWASFLFAKQFSVEVSDAPVVTLANVAQKKLISVVRPLEIELTTQDTIHTYELLTDIKVDEKQEQKKVACESQSGNLKLLCDTVQLGLSHGESYSLELRRAILGVTPAQSVTRFNVTTLDPVSVAETSISNGQTVYDTPTSINILADKPLSSAKVELTRKNSDDKVSGIEKVTVDGSRAVVVLKEELARKSEYTLTVTQLYGVNGESLAKPHVITFTTSGGPKVVSVSAATAGISSSERIVVTFDQPIDDSVDITKFARVVGAGAIISKQSPTQIAYTLQGASLCAAVTISLSEGIKSGSNSALSDEAWQFNTRVACGTSSVIGYSVNGRPIVAYYFGSGADTVLFTGGMHGSEPSGYYTMQSWVNYLMTNGNIIPGNKRVVIVPNTNPDGIAAGSRNSSTNVNIARNFPTANWQADIETTSGVLQNGGGTSPGSEPETAALIALTRQLSPRLQVSFHAQGSLVGANKYGDSVTIGDIYASTVGYQTMYYNAEAVMGYPMTGEYEDWMGEEMGIPAILIELPTTYANYFNSQLSALKKMLNV